MGSASSGNSAIHQKCQALSTYTPEDIQVLQWRSNPQFNQFIPKVIFHYQETKKTGTFIDHCQQNQNHSLGVLHQKFIGNLTILNGKLSFEEALFAVKSLLSGHQTLLTYFGKTVVSPNFCFLSKKGQIKAWINEDYRKNTFPFDLSGENLSCVYKENLFLKPDDWVDHNKSSSSEANIIQKVLFLVAGLTFQQQKFNSFLQSLDSFITGNILKNFNFDRVKKFANKYIYQKKIFLKSNLLEVVERLYYETFQEKEDSTNLRSVFQRESHIERKPSHMTTIREQQQQNSFENSPLILRNLLSPEKRSSLQDMQTKNSQFFSSTAYTNTNQSSKFMQSPQNSYFKDGPIYGSYCMSQISGPHFPDSIQVKPSFSKNHISPQYCMNYLSVTEKLPQSRKRSNSQAPSLRSSVISNNVSNKNINNVDFKMAQKGLRVIHERKQTDPQEKQDKINKKRQKELKTSIQDSNQSNHISVGLSFGKRISRIAPKQQKTNIAEANKKSCVSIALKAESNPNLLRAKTVTLLKSNCESSDKQNHKSVVIYGEMNTPSQKSFFNENGNQTNQNFFTLKTITRLISSNQNISEQQHSEGDFPSIQNESSYSGILASMGRSVQILNVPERKKSQFRTSKKPHTIFTRDQEHSSAKIASIKSYNVLLKR